MLNRQSSSDILLSTHNLSIAHGRRAPLAAGLNLQLGAGRLVCLLGPNGAGKSTLLRTLGGMQKPAAGRVYWRGQDLYALPARARAQALSVVLTERPALGLLTGYGLVALGRHPHTNWRGALGPEDEAQIRWAVAAVGAEEIAAQPVMQLSDGQRQKLMIARALAQESPVILLDEPTAFLDWPRRAEVMKLLKALAHRTGRAILLSTHDLDLAIRAADELWVMAAGELRRACPEELSQNSVLAWAFGPEGAVFDARR